MRRPALAALALALSLGVLTAQPGTARSIDDDPRPRVTSGLHVAKGLRVIGDSITYNSRRELQQRRPAWQIDAKRGRPVTALRTKVDHLLATGVVPRNLVLALGSNARRSWTRADFEDVVDRLPRQVNITLMTTYRSPRYFAGHPVWGKRPRVQKRYSRWMVRVARERSHVCIMPWRRVARNNPHLLKDGVHPNWRGKHRWARLVIRSAGECRRR
jgi:hypothetical protein